MTVPIPEGTEFSYNGFTFPVNCITKVTEEPIPSGDNRVIKYSRITINVTGWITQTDMDSFAADEGLGQGETLDALMQSVRRKLQVNGKRLAYVNRGYGMDLLVNDAEGLSDVAMGPKVGRFMFSSLGGAPDGVHGARFEWSVSTCIAECESFSNNPGPGVFTEISFRVTYETDHAGIVTITHSGKVEIPLRVRDNNNLTRNIDDVIESVIKPPSPGFLRRMSRTLSADRASADFTITDTQIEVPYPPGVVSIDMEESIRQTGTNVNVQMWACTLSGTVRMSPDARKSDAWRRFWNIAAYRMTLARSGLGGVNVVIPGPIELREKLFTNESSFVIHFRLAGVPFSHIIRFSGLWTRLVGVPTPGMTEPWTVEQWATSLSGAAGQNKAQKLKGVLGASFDNDNEIIVDVCTGHIGNNPHIADPPAMDFSPDDLLEAAQEVVSESELAQIEPSTLLESGGKHDDDDEIYPAEASWIAWVCVPERIVDYRITRHKPLGGTASTNTPTVDPFGPVDAVRDDESDPDAGFTSDTPDVVQQISAPSMLLRLRGYGVRINHRVVPPKLVSYGGQKATLVSERIKEDVSALGGDVPIYRTAWDLIYIIPGAPGSIPLPANPVLGLDGQSGA